MNGIDVRTLRDEFDVLDETVQRQFANFEEYCSYRNAGASGKFVANPAECLSFSVTDANVTVEPAAKFDEATATDEQLEEHFGQTQELQDQFSGVECYLALMHSDRRVAEKKAWRMNRREVKDARAKAHAELVGQTEV